MSISAAEIERIARWSIASDVHDLPELATLVLDDEQRLAPTLYSAWHAEGRPWTTPMEAVVEHHHLRNKRYAELSTELQQRCSDSRPLKGQAIAALYPPDVVRETHDLDMLVPDIAGLWCVADALADHGYSPEALTIQLVNGQPVGMLALNKPLGEFEQPDRVDVASLPLFGDLIGLVPRSIPRGLTAAEELLLLLLEERSQHEFVARDLVDATILLRQPDLHPRAVWRALDRLDIWPEYVELLQELSHLGVADRDSWLPATYRARVSRAKRRRARRWLNLISNPRRATLLVGQRALIGTNMPAAVRMLWSIVQRGTPSTLTWSSGLPLFGVQLDSVHADAFALRTHRCAPVAVAETPIGTFALTTADSLDERHLAPLLVERDSRVSGEPH